MSAVICLSSPVDVLSVVPHLLGFHPSSPSLVLVCLSSHGTGARVGMVARIDLPEEGDADRGRRRAATGCRPRRSRRGGPHRLRHTRGRRHRGRRGPRAVR